MFHVPERGELFDLFGPADIESNGGLAAIEEQLANECTWYARLGQVDVPVNSQGELRFVVDHYARMRSKWEAAGAPKILGRRHPCFGLGTWELSVYEVIVSGLRKHIETRTHDQNGFTLREVTLSRSELTAIATCLFETNKATFEIETVISHIFLRGSELLQEDEDANFEITLRSEANPKNSAPEIVQITERR